MMFRDKYGYPVDSTLDGGDSAVRASILAMSKSNDRFMVKDYVNHQYLLMRHPSQIPWNNPRNCSRDQTVMLVAGLHSLKHFHEVIEHIFYSTLKRFSFAQNFDKDAIGTPKHLPEDFADPILPNVLGMMILGGKVYAAYWFLPVCWFFHLLFLFGPHTEENQTIAECSVYGTLPLYQLIRRKWEPNSFKYWYSRGETEYHDMLVKIVKGEK